jgi:hypothetical protein
MKRRRGLSALVITSLAAMVPVLAVTSPAAASSVGAQVRAAQQPPGPAAGGGRNVRRTPQVLSRALSYSPGCSGTTVPIDCTITEPVVTAPQTTYSFSFLPGDHVVVNAGGCVQTGGSGLTWKRYVDPASDNDLYHGLITIPGATGSLVRLVDMVGRQYVVGGRGGSLVLGYEDDGYSDNGYYSHDNGTGNQCLNSVNAYVHIVIS